MIKTLLWCCSGIRRFSVSRLRNDLTAQYSIFLRCGDGGCGTPYPAEGLRSEPEHVVEAEGAALAQEAVIAEQPPGRVNQPRAGGGRRGGRHGRGRRRAPGWPRRTACDSARAASRSRESPAR